MSSSWQSAGASRRFLITLEKISCSSLLALSLRLVRRRRRKGKTGIKEVGYTSDDQCMYLKEGRGSQPGSSHAACVSPPSRSEYS